MDNKTPLWMPAGSVRAIIALTVVAALVIPDISISETIVGMVLAFYFGTKKQ